MYCYTVENLIDKEGNPARVETKYALSLGMHVEIKSDKGSRVFQVKEILMYNDDAVIVVEEI